MTRRRGRDGAARGVTGRGGEGRAVGERHCVCYSDSAKKESTVTATPKTIAGDSVQSAVYVDMENLAGKGKELLIELLTKWPVKAPKPSVVHLYVRADQVGLWSVWGDGRFRDVRIVPHGVQHYSNTNAKNSADVALVIDAITDLLIGATEQYYDSERRQRFPGTLYGHDLASGHAVSGRSASLLVGCNRRYGEAVRDNSFICAAGASACHRRRHSGQNELAKAGQRGIGQSIRLRKNGAVNH